MIVWMMEHFDAWIEEVDVEWKIMRHSAAKIFTYLIIVRLVVAEDAKLDANFGYL